MGIKCPECKTTYEMEEAIKEFGYRSSDGTISYHLRCSSCRESPKKRKNKQPQVVCNKCGVSIDQDKAHELFDRRKDRQTGFQYSCRKCRKKQNEKYKSTKAAKEEINKRARERSKQRNSAASTKKRRDKQRLSNYAELILKDEPVGNSARTFHFALKLLLERQFELYYDDIKSVTGVQRKREVINDAIFEIKDVLSRVSDRMKRISDSEPKSPLDHSLTGVNGKRDEALRILGLPRSATDEEIKKRYKDLAVKAHPDHGGSAEKMAELNAAMSMLEES